MKKTIDCVLSALISAFLTFAWCRYLLKDNLPASVAACLVGLCVGYITLFVGNKKHRAASVARQKKSTIAALSQRLTFGTDNTLLFAELLRYYNYKCAATNDPDSLFVERDGNKFLVTLCFFDDKLTATELRREVVKARRNDCRGLLIFCHDVDGAARVSAKTAINYEVEVKIFDISDIACLLSQADKMPPLSAVKPVGKVGIAGGYALCRKQAVKYMLASLFLTAISFVSYIKLYNMLWASLLFALGVYSLFNKRYNGGTTDVTL